MTSLNDVAVKAEIRLRALIGRGFQFLYPHDTNGELAAVVGIRAHDNVIDIIKLHNSDHAVATRMPADEENVLLPTRYTWRRSGSACIVLEELLELPDDHVA
jgi:hypothetical protein